MGDKTKRLAQAGMFTALILLLGLTPLGYPAVSIFKLTIVQVPVALGAMILGPYYGLFFGFLFGMTSMYQAAISGLPTAPIFMDPLVAVVPRLIVPLGAWAVYMLMKKALKIKSETINGLFSGAAASITNTVFVLLAVFILHAGTLATAININVSTVGAVLVGIVVSSGIPEMIASAILCGALLAGYSRLFKKGEKA